MLLKIRRGRNSTNSGSYYMLLNGKKISPNGGWCVPETLQLLGKGFDFNAGEGVEVSVNYGHNKVSWIPDSEITPRIPVEYPLYAQSKTNYVIFLFESKNVGTAIWIPKRKSGFYLGKTLNEKYTHLMDVTIRSHWRILEHFDVFSFNARNRGNQIQMQEETTYGIDLGKGKDRSVTNIIRKNMREANENLEIW